MVLGKLLDDSTEEKIEVFKMDMKKLFDYTEGEEEVSLYIKGKDEVHANGVHCRPTLFVLEKLLQDLGFYSHDVKPTESSGVLDVFFKNYSPKDMAIIMTYLHLGLIDGKIIKMPDPIRGVGKDKKGGTKRARKEAEKANEEERKYAITHKVMKNDISLFNCYKFL